MIIQKTILCAAAIAILVAACGRQADNERFEIVASATPTGWEATIQSASSETHTDCRVSVNSPEGGYHAQTTFRFAQGENVTIDDRMFTNARQDHPRFLIDVLIQCASPYSVTILRPDDIEHH
ncbi:hypothetical protein AWH62_07625 [Maricaulis sp. W15]|nr:hypothetical protein AWH62_07625 [Maricaulis sp. W15]